jgi:hypothetical protein
MMLFALAFAGYELRQPRGDDMGFHFSSWIEVLHQWRQGVLYPRWSELANYGFGEPRFVFYPPGSPMLGAALGSVIPWPLVPQAFVCLVLAGAGLAMFRLAREFLPPMESAWAALLYAFNPYALFLAYGGSRMAELQASMFLPLLVLYVVRVDVGRSDIAILKLAVVFAACWLVNVPTAVISTYCLPLLALVLAVSRRSARILLRAMASMVLGFLLAAFYVLPAVYEKRWVTLIGLANAPFYPENNFLFSQSPLRKGGTNLYISLIALGEFAVTGIVLAIFALRRRRSSTVQPFVLVLAGACALFMFSITALAWKWLPGVQFVQFPTRLLAMFNVACAYLIVATVPVEGSGQKRAWLLAVTAGWAMAGAVSVLRMPIHSLTRMEFSQRNVVEEILSGLRRGGIFYNASSQFLPAACRLGPVLQSLPRGVAASGVTGGVDVERWEVEKRLMSVETPLPGTKAVFASSTTGRIDVERWDAEKRRMHVETSDPGTVVIRLFSYPGWTARVNGDAVATQSWSHGCVVAIPIPAGKSQLDVTFCRTPDRTVGGLLSISAAVLALGILFRRFSRDFLGSRAR